MKTPGFSLMVYGVVGEAAGFQQGSGAVEVKPQAVGGVSVGTYGDQAAAQTAVAAEDFLAGVGMAQAVMKSAGIALQSFSLLNQSL